MDCCKRMNGTFCRGELKTIRDINGYEWKVIVDPTRSKNDPGLFYGGLFRMIDLRLDRDEKSSWPDGIVLEHILTGQRLTFDKGRLFDLTNGKALVRKSRERNRRGKNLANKIISKSDTSRMRRFIMIRNKDASGVSGTGVVAEGTVFTDGLSVIHWLREPYAIGVYPTLNDVISVHGHEGGTQLHFIDENGIPQVSEGGSQ